MSDGSNRAEGTGADTARTTADLDAEYSPAADPLAPGTSLGRYVLLAEAGRGGMGRVYQAYDPRLRREVALKLVLAATADAEARATREAHAMAALSDPNVVAVYDVDKVDGRLFIVMEFVAGSTLREWIADRGTDLSASRAEQAIGLLVEAGRGLAAAHRAGLVHRDFKPGNIILGDDQRVRVTDFGLATSRGTELSGSGEDESSELHLAGDDSGSHPLTRLGAVLGTPKYMAPEQHRALELGPRSDQYSFCVVLFEAIYGQRPFRARKLERLAQAKEAGPAEFPSTPAVESRIAAALRRGLAPDPSDRFPTMDALLDAIVPRPSKGGRTGLAMLGAAFLVAAAGSAAWVGLRSNDTCATAGADIFEVWDETARGSLHTALSASGLAFATDTADRTAQRFDRYAESWASSRKDACEATEVRKTQTAAVRDRRIACLEKSKRRFGLTIDALQTEVDASTVRHALRAAMALPPSSNCDDIARLLAMIEPPSDTATQTEVERLRGELTRAEALSAAGRYGPALAIVDNLNDAANRVDYPAFRAERWQQQGNLLIKTGDYEKAQSVLELAYAAAISSGHDDIAAKAIARLAFVTGNLLQDHTAALAQAGDAKSWAERLNTPAAWARYYNAHAGVLQQVARYDEAQEMFERTLELREQIHAPGSPQIANAANNLGNVHMDQGRPEQAAAMYRRALTLTEDAFGELHPRVGAFANNLSNALDRLGDLDAAQASLERALKIYEGVHGREHPDVAGFVGNLGGLALRRGQTEQARALYEEALELERKVLIQGHPRLAKTLGNLAALELGASRLDAALKYAMQAVETAEAAYGVDHPGVAAALEVLAAVYVAQPTPEAAIPVLERAIEIRATTQGDPAAAANAKFALARALSPKGRAPPRALEFARAARRDASPEVRADIETWLNTHQPTTPPP